MTAGPVSGHGSLAWRLVCGVALITAGAMALGALSTWSIARWSALAAVDERLFEMQAHGRLMHQRPPPPGPMPNLPDEPNGPLMRFHPSAGEQRQSPRFPAELPPLRDERTPQTLEWQGRRYRGLLLTAHLSDPPSAAGARNALEVPHGTVEALIDLAPLEAESRRLGGILAGLWLASTGLAALLARLLGRFLVAPVARLSARIADIDEHRLGLRLEPAGPVELRPIVEHINALLARLEQAFAREKETLHTIAHELRTPVTIQRGCLEFALLDGDQPVPPDMARRCLNAAITMQRLIEDLLSLARCEAGLERPRSEVIDLAAILHRARDALQPRATARRLLLFAGATADPPVLIRGVPGLTETAIASLLGNAIDHAPVGDHIDLHWHVTPAEVRLTLRNALPASAADHITQQSHLGLGLPLCRRIMRVLGGRLDSEVGGCETSGSGTSGSETGTGWYAVTLTFPHVLPPSLA
jgi:signal transduction histidine kinase